MLQTPTLKPKTLPPPPHPRPSKKERKKNTDMLDQSSMLKHKVVFGINGFYTFKSLRTIFQETFTNNIALIECEANGHIWNLRLVIIEKSNHVILVVACE